MCVCVVCDSVMVCDCVWCAEYKFANQRVADEQPRAKFSYHFHQEAGVAFYLTDQVK